jgi:6-phosphofructokinase 1
MAGMGTGMGSGGIGNGARGGAGARPRALVALGGGPSPVINASLLGVVEACRARGDVIGDVYGALHGIEGVLQERLVDLGAQDARELAKLRHTPASGAIGTCRYKLGAGGGAGNSSGGNASSGPDGGSGGDSAREDYVRIVDVLAAHGVGYFFYIGGNDSMDTAHKVSQLARERGVNLVVAGVPKTIDNDLGDEARTLIDHTPGYGSVARYWAMLARDVEEENRGMCVSEPVAVLQAMGRRAGFITAAARLADPGRETPLQLYFAETGQNLEALAENVGDSVRRRGRCVVVMTEGFDVGDIGAQRDGFGHTEFGASQTTAAQAAVNYLNRHGLPARGLATGQLPGVLQRCTSVFRSPVDVEEAYQVGRHAVATALAEGTGYMATILRAADGDGRYRAAYGKVPLDVIANTERRLPPEWIAPGGIDVTDDFVRYAAPLIGDGMAETPLSCGLQDFARLDLRPVAPKLPGYVPANFRRGARA